MNAHSPIPSGTAQSAVDAGSMPAPSRRILVAEDNAISRMLIGHQLRVLGFDPVCAEDGERAAAAWRDQPFSMLLTDLQMPKMDGFGLAAVVRDATDRTRIPIVALTANGSSAEAEQCRAADIDDCMAKPVTLEALSLVLEKWLGVTAVPIAP